MAENEGPVIGVETCPDCDMIHLLVRVGPHLSSIALTDEEWEDLWLAVVEHQRARTKPELAHAH